MATCYTCGGSGKVSTPIVKTNPVTGKDEVVDYKIENCSSCNGKGQR